MPQLKASTGKSTSSVFPFTFKVKSIFLVVVSFIFYSNTLQNGYLLDDNLAIVSNDYVQQGFSGIGKILTEDSYISWMKKSGMDKHKLTGGRYRPLSIVVFAIEHSLFGESTFMRHLVHILFYCLLVFLIFWFLDKFLFLRIKGGGDVAFLAALLFAIHPIHVEVAANIKSLDEILSLLFVVLTFIFSLRYIKDHKIPDLLIGIISYLFSLLAKEYTVMMLLLLPMLFYLVGNKKPLQAIVSSLPYYGMFVVYMILRIHAVGLPSHAVNNDVAINPYLYATHSQTIATKFFVLEKYLGLLFFPYPLTYDYNYADVPYHNFSDLSVWLSIFIYAAIIVWGGWLLYKKNILAFPVFFFLLNLALVSNFLTDISSLMGERLVFQTSLGFVVILSYAIFEAIKKWPYSIKRASVFAFFGLLTIICGAETLNRNTAWKDFQSLTTTDVNKVPNSILANNYAAMSYIYLASKEKDSVQAAFYSRQAIICGLRAVRIIKNYFDGYYRLASAYQQLRMPDSAIYYFTIAKNINPADSNLKRDLTNAYLSKAYNLGKVGDINGAIKQIWNSINEDPGDAIPWYNLGGAYYTAGKYDSARFAWMKTLSIDPSNADAKRGLSAIPISTNGK